MKRVLFSVFILLFAVCVQAQIHDPVKFDVEWKNVSDNEIEILFTGIIESGWHVYSTELGDGGPVSATFNVDKLNGAELEGGLKPVGKEISAYDPLFEMDLRYFERTARFVQRLKLTG